MLNNNKVIPLKNKAEEEEHSEEMDLLLHGDHDDAPKHVDSEGVWLISYADMMTLLMGFFALMTSMASFDTPEFEEIGKKTAEHFGAKVDAKSVGAGENESGQLEEMKNAAAKNSGDKVDNTAGTMDQSLVGVGEMDSGKMGEANKSDDPGTGEKIASTGAQDAASFKELGESLKKLIAEKNLQDKVNVKVSPSSVEMIFEGTMFFDSGSVTLKSDAQTLVQQMGDILEQKAKDKKFVIEGHTDDTPIHQGLVVSNWELSGLRASAVTHIFEQKGFPMDSILTIGWGSTRPVAPNRNPDGSANLANQAKNRRVLIKIMNQLPM